LKQLRGRKGRYQGRADVLVKKKKKKKKPKKQNTRRTRRKSTNAGGGEEGENSPSQYIELRSGSVEEKTRYQVILTKKSGTNREPQATGNGGKEEWSSPERRAHAVSYWNGEKRGHQLRRKREKKGPYLKRPGNIKEGGEEKLPSISGGSDREGNQNHFLEAGREGTNSPLKRTEGTKQKGRGGV